MSNVQDIAFKIRTCHGDYNHEADIFITGEMSDIAAWERIQSESPYTQQTAYDESNSSHRKCVQYVSDLRRGVNSYKYAEPGSMTVPGWSWTWIDRTFPLTATV